MNYSKLQLTATNSNAICFSIFPRKNQDLKRNCFPMFRIDALHIYHLYFHTAFGLKFMFGPTVVTHASIHFRYVCTWFEVRCVKMWEIVVIEPVSSQHTSKRMLPFPMKNDRVLFEWLNETVCHSVTFYQFKITTFVNRLNWSDKTIFIRSFSLDNWVKFPCPEGFFVLPLWLLLHSCCCYFDSVPVDFDD